ncbi:MAG: GNAT family N-acetyltransferase [Patescibacteria group bacterium]
MLKIIPFENKYLEEMAGLFANSYSDSDSVWNLEHAKERVWENVKSFPECNLVAIDDNGKFLGGILCQKYVNYNGPSLYVDSIQVLPESRKEGLGKLLLEEAIKIAKDLGVKSVFFYVDSEKIWLTDWYEKLGFEKTKWVAYASKIGDLKI